MLFDWFTFVAQLINFLILAWLLKRYLFKPILDTIDQRESMIANQLHEAEDSKTKANDEFEHYQQKKSAFDQQRDELFNEAISQVNAEKQKLLVQTRHEVESLRLRLQESLRTEQQNMGSEIIRRTRTEVFAIVRKTLSDLASVNLEDQMAGVFINRINNLQPGEKKLFYAALNNSSGEILIQSMFDLPVAQQSAIQQAIKNNLEIELEINFKTVPQLVSGIELISGGYKISWSIEEYLSSLETHIAELLNQNIELPAEKVPE